MLYEVITRLLVGLRDRETDADVPGRASGCDRDAALDRIVLRRAISYNFV